MVTLSDHDFMIERFHSILFLANNKIIIQLKKKKVEIIGIDLYIDYYSKNEIRGKGHLVGVNFFDEK